MTFTWCRKYEALVLLAQEFTEDELKTWSFNFAKNLKIQNASEVSILSCGKKNLSYPIKKQGSANFIQIQFSIVPKFVNNVLKTLKKSDQILRIFILKEL